MNALTDYAKLVEKHGLHAVLNAVDVDFDWQMTGRTPEQQRALRKARQDMQEIIGALGKVGIFVNDGAVYAHLSVYNYMNSADPHWLLVLRDKVGGEIQRERIEPQFAYQLEDRKREFKSMYALDAIAEFEWFPAEEEMLNVTPCNA